jgi:chorismate dehydratase
VPLRVAAISFLNPAPLLYNFEHPPEAAALRTRYDVHYTSPAHCARELHTGNADLGLIPIAELEPGLVVVPGCTIASTHNVRSILLLVKNPHRLPVPEALRHLVTLSADAASRSSIAYARLLLKRFYDTDPVLFPHAPDPVAMLADADAALLIGDPALLARERRKEIDAAFQQPQDTQSQNTQSQNTQSQDTQSQDTQSQDAPLLWIDLAALWREHTGLPWVAAVWAVRPETLPLSGLTPQQLTADLIASRDNGLAHIDDLVREWTPRIALPPETIHTYLSTNIHYTLDADCLSAIELFRTLSAELGILPSLPKLNLLT